MGLKVKYIEPVPDKNFSDMKHGAHVVYILIVGIVFLALTIIFLFFPRSTYSELEKRDLATFPEPSDSIKAIDYTALISQWFSDSEPYRDVFMTWSMKLRDGIKLQLGDDEDIVSIRPASDAGDGAAVNPLGSSEPHVVEASGNPLANENAKIANRGIVVVGKEPNVRAMTSFGGSEKSAQPYINAIAAYREAFPNINLYALPIPTTAAFYLPDKAKSASKPQEPVINYIKASIPQSVKFVDVLYELSGHTKEDIYLRTDHHWAPLGAFYAARELARIAGVPFKGLDAYEKKVIHDFVGSMYGYSKDIAVKKSPEDFVYYKPMGTNAEATFISYKLNKDYNIYSTSEPYKTEFFKQYKDGSGSAYLTFMGGDSHNVKIDNTGVNNGRRVLFIKDSYGNALPGYFFFSFDEIHVVDFRYFTRNIKEYVKENGITDIVFAFNLFNTANGSAMEKIKNFLTQPDGVTLEGKKDNSNSKNEEKQPPKTDKKAKK